MASPSAAFLQLRFFGEGVAGFHLTACAAALMAIVASCFNHADALAGHAEPRAAVCFDITCAQVECRAPFELRRAPGQCCSVCWAEDHEVALDRHTALEGENPFARDTHPAAPSSCAGARCFTPSCSAGYTPGHVEGRCCETCIPGR